MRIRPFSTETLKQHSNPRLYLAIYVLYKGLRASIRRDSASESYSKHLS